MFLSAVRSKSKPSLSAAASKSPLLSRSQPRSLAVVTLWPSRNRAMPLGVTWSKRMSIYEGALGAGRSRRFQASGGEFQHGVDLFPRDVKLLDDLIYSGSRFEVLKHCGHRHPRVTKNPCAAKSAGYALYGGALRPIETRHNLSSFLSEYLVLDRVSPNRLSRPPIRP